MGQFLKMFKTKPLGTLLRLRIKGLYVEITFDQDELGVYDLPLYQLGEKLDEYFSVKVFTPEVLAHLDGISIHKRVKIKDSNNLQASHQSVLEFLCELVFISSDEDVINLTKAQHKKIRDSIIDSGIEGLIDIVIMIAKEVEKMTENSQQLAFGVFDISDKGDNPLVEWVKDKHILSEVRDILRRIHRGNTSETTIEMIANLKDIDLINPENFPQLDHEKSASIRDMITNMKNILMMFSHKSYKEIAEIVNHLSKRKGIIREILKSGFGPNLIKSIEPIQYASLIKTIEPYLDKTHLEDFILQLIQESSGYMARVYYYVSDKLREDILEIILRQNHPYMLLGGIYVDEYINELRDNPYRRDKEEVLRFLRQIIKNVVSEGIDSFQEFLQQIKSINYSKKIQQKLNNDLKAVILDYDKQRKYCSYV